MNNEEAKKQWMALNYISDSDYEREIDILDCLFYVLDKWRSLVLIGVVVLLVVSAFKFYTGEKGRAENDALIAEGREDEVIYSDAYQDALDALQEQEREIRKLETNITEEKTKITELSNSIEDRKNDIASLQETVKIAAARKSEVEKKLEDLNTYLDNSALMLIEATSKPVAKRRYQIAYAGGSESTESLFRDPCDEIVSAYAQNVTLNEDGSALGEKYGIDKKYLDELFSVSADTGTNTVYVTATGTDQAMAQEILSEVCKIVEGKKNDISGRYHAHTLKKVAEEYNEVMDEGLLGTQAQRIAQQTDYQASIHSYEDQINAGNTTIDNTNLTIESYNRQIEDAQEAIVEYEEDIQKLNKKILEDKLREKVEAKAPSMMRTLKDAIKAALIVAVVAAVVLAGIYFLLYLLGGKLHTATDLISVYNIPLFAVLNRKDREKQNWIDKLLRTIFKRVPVTSDEEILKTAAVSIQECVEGKGKVALLATGGEEALKKAAGALEKLVHGAELVPVAGAYVNAESAKKLNEMDAVILYETREESSLNAIDEEIRQAVVLDKPVLGCIIA